MIITEKKKKDIESDISRLRRAWDEAKRDGGVHSYRAKKIRRYIRELEDILKNAIICD